MTIDLAALETAAAGNGSMRLVYMDPRDIVPNPGNHKEHPPEQREQFTALLYGLGNGPGEIVVGWADALIVNDRKVEDGWAEGEAELVLLDGEGRREVAIDNGDQLVPVILNSYTPTQEAVIMATYDTSSLLAKRDLDLWLKLTGRIQEDRDIIKKLITLPPEELKALENKTAAEFTLAFGKCIIPMVDWEADALEDLADQ